MKKTKDRPKKGLILLKMASTINSQVNKKNERIENLGSIITSKLTMFRLVEKII